MDFYFIIWEFEIQIKVEGNVMVERVIILMFYNNSNFIQLLSYLFAPTKHNNNILQ